MRACCSRESDGNHLQPGAIYGVALSPVKAVIPDLLHHEEQLLIEGEANGPLQDFIRFSNSARLGEILRGLPTR